ncbi:MAG: cyclopropane fatty acyl phospholipid synthase [Desulfobulbus sp.]|nr:cyclopropane fatty acyl phospholipid synthase [Desulfobulbus sp.]
MITRTVTDIFTQAGVAINGSNPWDIQVEDNRFYRRIFRDKNLGLGEAYMDGWWECPRIDEMICRLLRVDAEGKIRGALRYLLSFIPEIICNLQSKSRSHIVARKHYDTGNDLFFSFLDPYCQYSCGYFNTGNSLESAQRGKLDLIAQKMELSSQDHLLDIGCGWGGLAHYFSSRYGCTVTAVNISQQQLQYARDWCRGLPVSFQDCDYRLITGVYDKVVSVGMFEHVGVKNYRTYMKIVAGAMRDNGIFLLHTIGSNITKSYNDPWITTHIFPNSQLPSMHQIAKAIEGIFIIEDLHNLGPHYDKTLMAWNARFQQSWGTMKGAYDERFKRMWEYYLLSCAGAFRARAIQLWQLVLTKQGCVRKQPLRCS